MENSVSNLSSNIEGTGIIGKGICQVILHKYLWNYLIMYNWD